MTARHRMVGALTLLTGLWFTGGTAAMADGWKLPALRLWPAPRKTVEQRPPERGVNQASFQEPIESDRVGFEIRPLWPSIRLDIPTPAESLNAGIDTIRAGSQKLQQGAAQLRTGTQRVWHSTRSTLSAPFASDTRRDPRQPSLWQQMFGPPEDEGPQTVRQFLSQERP